MLQVEIRSKIVGSSPSEDQLPNIALELLNETLTIRELITHTVEEQVTEMLTKQKIEIETARRILQRQYLTEADIAQQAEQGAIRDPNVTPKKPAELDSKTEVKKAVEAFEKNTYLIIIDGEQADSLDQVVTLSPTSKVTFLRLTPLVGG